MRKLHACMVDLTRAKISTQSTNSTEESSVERELRIRVWAPREGHGQGEAVARASEPIGMGMAVEVRLT